jgi:putative ABC transport system permease protein
MFTHLLKTAFRNIFRQKGYTIAIMMGLSISIACSFLIVSWVRYEFSYNKFHENIDQLHVLVSTRDVEGGQQMLDKQPPPLAQLLKDNVPEIKDVTRIISYSNNLSHNNNSFVEPILYTDPSFLTMFSFQLISGNPESALSEPYSVVLSKSYAQKYFGDKDPINEELILENWSSVKVTGVVENPPSNSSIQFDIIAPLTLLAEMGVDLENWGMIDYKTYVQLQGNPDTDKVAEKINSFCGQIFDEDNTKSGGLENRFLHPLSRVHLYSLDGNDNPIYKLYGMMAMAFIVLLIACFNYANNSAARFSFRAREIGMKKLMGAGKTRLIIQYMTETALIVVLACILAIPFVEIIISLINSTTQIQLIMPSVGINDITSLLIIALMATLAAGLYPAFVISTFKPIDIVRGQVFNMKSSPFWRRFLVGSQFALTLSLIICTMVVNDQLQYMLEKDKGIDIEDVVYFRTNQELILSYDSFKNELEDNQFIHSVASSRQLINNIGSTVLGCEWEGKADGLEPVIRFEKVNLDYTKTFNLKVLEGRFYSDEFPSDLSDGLVLNKAAAELMGHGSPIGKRFSFWGYDKNIIGVVDNFHSESMVETIKPLILIYSDRPGFIYVKIDPENVPAALSQIENVYNSFEFGTAFEYQFLNESYKRQYTNEQSLSFFTISGSVVVILLACLGLLSLVTGIAEARLKEIAIRKVLGSSVGKIVYLLTKEYLLPVLVANLIAWPISFILMRKWLQNFAYNTGLGWEHFILPGLFTLIVAIGTASFKTWSASMTNPADLLKQQ